MFTLPLAYRLIFQVAVVLLVGSTGLALLPQEQSSPPPIFDRPLGPIFERKKPNKNLFNKIFRIFLPENHRINNWDGDEGTGCCGHAVCSMMLHEAGQDAMAVWWRQNHNRPSTIYAMVEELNQRGYASRHLTSIHQVEQAVKEGKPVGYRLQTPGGWHACMVVELSDKEAKYVDPNNPDKIMLMDRQAWNQQFSVANDAFVIDQESKEIQKMRREYKETAK